MHVCSSTNETAQVKESHACTLTTAVVVPPVEFAQSTPVQSTDINHRNGCCGCDHPVKQKLSCKMADMDKALAEFEAAVAPLAAAEPVRRVLLNYSVFRVVDGRVSQS